MSLRKAKRKIDRYMSNPQQVIKDLEKSQNQRKRTAERVVKFNKKKGYFLKARIFVLSLFVFFAVLFFYS